MKFSDIKPFIDSGHYQIDVQLHHLEKTLENWTKDYGLELNPDFQRGHVWTEEQQVAYMEFLLRGGTSAKVVHFNSPAFGRKEAHCDLEDTLLCVDGLQRMTSCLRFVRNEIKVFGHYYSEYEDSPRLRQGIQFNVNSLQTRAEVLEWYLQMNNGGTVHSQEELNRVKELLEQEKEKTA